MLNKNSLQKLNIITASLCILILGVIIGKYQERMFFNQTNAQIIPLEKDINEGVPMVKILGLKDGVIVGTISDSSIRLTTEEEIALIDQDLNFTLKFNDILRKDLLFHVPENMNYIASSRGKKFYNIYDSYAKKIAPQNRIFFQTKQAALSAGYIED